MTEGVGSHCHSPASRNRHSHGDHNLPQRGSKKEAECNPAAGVGHSDSEELTSEDEPESATCSSTPRADGGKAGGPAGDSQTVAPDGGWGWMVLLSTILVLALTLAFPSCIGIFYTDLQSEFNASNTETSWVPAIMTSVLHAGGPLCSVLVERFGCRATVMVGGVLSGFGMAVSALARTINQLYITGIVTGLGFCLSFQPSVTMMGVYFVRRRAFANALSSSGTALGLSTLPLLANYLLSQFGWRGSFLVLGGVLLNCCVCGAVMRPVGPASRPSPPKPPQSKPNHLHVHQEGEDLKGHLRTLLVDFVTFMRRHMAFDLLVSNPRYCAYAVGVTWMMLGFVVPLVYLVPYATDNGIEQGRAALLMSVLGLVNIAMRPAAALVFSLPRFKASGCFIYLFGAAVLVNGLSNIICGVSASFNVLLVYVVLYGVSMSVIGSLLFTVLMETVEMSRFPSALGLISMLESGTLLIGPPIAGMLVDSTGQYSYVFYACSVSVSSSGLYLMASFYYLDNKKEKVESNNKKAPGVYQKPVVALTHCCKDGQLSLPGRKATDTVYVTSV